MVFRFGVNNWGKNRIPTGTEIAQIFPVITDTREVLITYYVSSDYLPLLDKGQTVRLKLEKIGNHGTTIIGQLQTIDQTPTRTEQGNLFKLTALAKLSNEDSKLIQYGLQGRVTSVTTKKTYFDYFKDKILTHSD
ncbi:BlpC ABC transporter [Streptococcus pneumoniae]|nr:BlpC ABC transporter [Streptococcus pneumoniae]VPB69010.1 BlpC ABC transporter [Streptococcus pneumoniae]